MNEKNFCKIYKPYAKWNGAHLSYSRRISVAPLRFYFCCNHQHQQSASHCFCAWLWFSICFSQMLLASFTHRSIYLFIVSRVKIACWPRRRTFISITSIFDAHSWNYHLHFHSVFRAALNPIGRCKAFNIWSIFSLQIFGFGYIQILRFFHLPGQIFRSLLTLWSFIMFP